MSTTQLSNWGSRLKKRVSKIRRAKTLTSNDKKQIKKATKQALKGIK